MNWAEFFSMGGRGFYVWGSYGAFAIAIIVEIILLRARATHAQAEVRAEMLAEKSKGGAR